MKPRKGSLAAFEERFKLELAAAIKSGITFPFGVALLAANAATKKAKRSERPKAPQRNP